MKPDNEKFYDIADHPVLQDQSEGTAEGFVICRLTGDVKHFKIKLTS